MVTHILKPYLVLLFLLSLPFIGMCQLPVPKWVNDFGGSGQSKMTGMATDKQNNIYITGYFDQTVDFDPSAGVYNLTSVGDLDIYVAKYRPDGALIWAMSMGGSDRDQVNYLGVDDNGNPTITGQYVSSDLQAGAFTLQSKGSEDIFIIHLNKNGDVIWAKTIGGSETDRGEEVNADAQGSVIETAIFQGTINVGATPVSSQSGLFNALIIKYSNSGNLLWHIDLLGTGNIEIYGNGIDGNGNVVVSGAYSGNIDFDPLGSHKVLNGSGGGFVAKYTPAGKLIWVNSINGNFVNNGSVLSIDSKNNIYIGAAFYGMLNFGGFQLGSLSSQDTFIAKYSSNGAFIFAKDLGGFNGSSFPYQIRNDQNNNIYITGYFSGTIDFDPDPAATAFVSDHGSRDFFISKYDPNGKYQWAFSGGNAGCSNTLGIELAVDNNNDAILGGSFCETVDFDPSSCTSQNVTAQNGISDSFLVKYVSGTTLTGEITNFSIPQQISSAIINQVNHSISITVAPGTNIKSLVPAISISAGTLSPAAGVAHDFTGPVVYTLTVGCTNTLYNVTVIVATSTAVTSCAGIAKTIAGATAQPAPDSYNWQILQNGVWVNAPGVISNKDYQTSSLQNNTNNNIVFNLRRKVTTQGNISYDSFYDVTVQPSVPIANNTATAPSVTAFCLTGDPGNIAGSTPSGGTGIYTYQWQSSVDNNTFTDIAGSVSKDYNPPVINTNVYYRRIVTSGSCVVPSISNVINITVLSAFTNNTITAPAITTFCSTGNPAVIAGSIPTGGNGIYNYQWQSSADNSTFTDIPNATAKDYDPSSINATTYYRRAVTSGACVTPSFSNVVKITIQTPLTNNIIAAPAITSFCSTGDPGVITGSIPSGGNGTYSYHWQSSADNINFTDITGAISKDYDPPVLNNDVYYRRTVTSGTCIVPLVSNVIKITVLPAISNNLITSPAITTFCSSGNPSAIIGSTPSGGTGTYTYQWQSSADNNTFNDIPGATLKDYDPSSINATTYYRRTVISAACIIPLVSNTITIVIVPAISNNVITAPATATFCSTGDPAIISGNVPAGGTGTFSYQWQSSADNIVFTDIPGAILKDYDPPVTNAKIYYRRTVTSGVCVTPLLSNVISITILPVLANNAIAAPAITTFCSSGDPAVIIGGTPTGGDGTYIYQWQSSADNINFTDIPGASLKDYDPPTVNGSLYYRRTVISGACVTPLLSNTININILPAIANNVLTAPAVTAFCSSGNPAVIVGSLPAGGTDAYSYQWQSSVNNINFTDIGGATSKDYDPPVTNADIYYRRTVISGICNTPLVSNTVKITISSPITNNTVSYSIICTNPNSVAVITGSIPVSGSIFTYQWQNSTDGINFIDINGETSKDYNPLVLSNIVYYRRQIISSACSSPSNIIAIKPLSAIDNNVITPPAIIAFCLNGDPGLITGTVPTGGDGNYSYQWQSSPDNTGYSDIAGATSKDFDPPPAAANIYYRRMVLSSNCITPSVSNTIHITILQNITNNVITAPAVTAFCSSGNPGVLGGNVPSGGNNTYIYQWQSSVDNINFTDIPGAALKDIDPAVISETTYYRRIVSSAACGTPVTSNVIIITITPGPATPVIVATPASVCPGNTASLSVASPQQGIVYHWYDSASKSNLLFTGPAYTTDALNTAKTYYVEATNGSCASTSLGSVQVNINSIPAIPSVNTPIAVCNGSAAALSVFNPQVGLTYNWYTTPTGGNSVFTGPDFSTTALTANAIYYVEAANGSGCPSIARAVVNITVNPLPQITAQGKAICPGEGTTLIASTNDQNAVINWYDKATGGNIIFTGNSFPTPILNAASTYYAEATDNTTGCKSATRSKAQIDIIQPLNAPVVSISETTTSSVSFKWNAVNGATGYQVSIDNGQTFIDPSSGSGGLTHTVTGLQPLQSVTIIVRAAGASPCQLSGSSIAITGAAVSPLGNQIFVANAFTPNGDGRNDIVYVHGANIKNLKFYVYDQWGELLYTSVNLANGWDGYYKGSKEPVGVYVYYVEAIMNDGQRVNKKGTITLLR